MVWLVDEETTDEVVLVVDTALCGEDEDPVLLLTRDELETEDERLDELETWLVEELETG